MSNILNEHIDTLNEGSLLDTNIDYIDTFDDYTETYFNDNYENLSTTSNTTPEFSSPNEHPQIDAQDPTHAQKKEFHDHFYYLNNYDYRPFKHVKSASFSLPDKLNSLNLSQPSSKSPSPEFIYHNKQEIQETATINPQDIFTLQREQNEQKQQQKKERKQIKSPAASGASGPSGKSFPISQPPTVIPPPTNYKESPKDYILPSSSSSPNLTSIFNQFKRTKSEMDFKMNNECFNAIKVWLNNNDMNNETDNEILINPTGIIKNSTTSNRRNSIQMVSHPPAVNAIEKRKRRKSTNSNANLNEFKSLMLNNDLEEEKKARKEELPPQQPLITSGSSPGYRNTSQLIDREEVLRQTIQSINFSQLEEEGKPFPCPDCNKQFKRSEHLKRHIRSVHSNIRPFHCKYCEKQFSRSDNLAQHLKTHYKVNSNGTTSIIYGNPNLHNRGGRRKNSGNYDMNIDSSTGTSSEYDT